MSKYLDFLLGYQDKTNRKKVFLNLPAENFRIYEYTIDQGYIYCTVYNNYVLPFKLQYVRL
jgi:hypothetical protein